MLNSVAEKCDALTFWQSHIVSSGFIYMLRQYIDSLKTGWTVCSDEKNMKGLLKYYDIYFYNFDKC